jgi:hypothetical protein
MGGATRGIIRVDFRWVECTVVGDGDAEAGSGEGVLECSVRIVSIEFTPGDEEEAKARV